MTKTPCYDCHEIIDVPYDEKYVNDPTNIFHCVACGIIFEEKLKELMSKK